MKYLFRCISVLSIALMIAGLLSCAARIGDSAEAAAPAHWVWPLPPDQPRIRFIETVITPKDLGITKGFFAKLWSFIVGEDTADRILVPHGVVSDGEGKVYVTDWGGGLVHYFNFKKKKYDKFYKTKLGKLASPIGVALDGEGRVYVSDSLLRRIFVFDGTKNKLVIGDDSLIRPTGIAINQKEGLLYVVDTGSHCVDVFDLKGKKLFSFGSHGSQDGQFNYPTHIALDKDGNVYVMDTLNFRVEIFGRSGKFKSSFGNNGTSIHDLMKPKGIAVDTEGHVWISDSFRNTIQVFDRKGTLLLIFGKLGVGPGQFNVPEGIFIDSANRLFVADSYNYRLQIYQFLGAGSAR